MVENLDEVLALKATAKSATADQDWQVAIDDLEAAVAVLRGRLPGGADSPPSALASELADAYGMIGGVHRRWGLSLDGPQRRHHLQQSLAAYDEGFRYERSLGPNDANTYNRINRLILRVLIDPHVLEKGGDGAVDVPRELRKAESIIADQLRSARQNDPWAYCDLGSIRLLLGEPDAMSAFQELDRLRPPAFVYQSALDTLAPLSEVASDIRPGLGQAVGWLRKSLRYAG